MPTNMSPQEGHKGTSPLLVTGAIALLVIGVGAMLWPRAPRAPMEPRPAATNNLRSDSTVGEGTDGFPAAPANVAPHAPATKHVHVAARAYEHAHDVTTARAELEQAVEDAEACCPVGAIEVLR